MSLQRIPVKKGRPAVLLALLAAVIVVMVLASKCSRPLPATATLHPPTVKSGGDTLDVAVELSALTYMPQGDTVTGLDYAILSRIACAHGIPVKFHPFAPLSYALDGMEGGLFDMVISTFPSTADFKSKYRLTEEVYRDREVLVQLKDSPGYVPAADGLGGDTVWIAPGSPFAGRIANLAAEIGDTIYVEQPQGRTAEHLVMLVASGDIPRAVVYGSLARRMKEELYPQLDTDTPVSFTQFQTWIVNPARAALADSLDVWLRQFRATPEYRALLESYKLSVPL